MINKWIGIGRTTHEPEIKYLANGDAVAKVNLACSESWKGKDGSITAGIGPRACPQRPARGPYFPLTEETVYMCL